MASADLVELLQNEFDRYGAIRFTGDGRLLIEKTWDAATPATATNLVSIGTFPYTQGVIEKITYDYSVVGGSGALMVLEKKAAGQAKGAGTAITGNCDLTLTADTVYSAPLIVGAALDLVAGTRIGVRSTSGTLTGLANLTVAVAIRILKL